MSEPDTREIIWKQTLHDRFECVVMRVQPKFGHLIVTDTKDGERMLYTGVRISWDGKPALAVEDIENWEQQCMASIAEKEAIEAEVAKVKKELEAKIEKAAARR